LVYNKDIIFFKNIVGCEITSLKHWIKERFEVLAVLICSALRKKIHKIAAGVVIRRVDGKFLLVREKMPIPGIFRKWNLPMGRKDKGEEPFQNAKREGQEETGFDLELGYKVGEYEVIIGPLVMLVHIFKANIIGGKLMVPADLLDVEWFSLEEIERFKHSYSPYELIHPYVLMAISDYIEKEDARQAEMNKAVSRPK